MFYFFVNLVLHTVVSGALLWLLLRFVRMNKNRKNKKGFTFLLPVLCVLIFSFHAFTNTLPKLGDVPAVIQSAYQPARQGVVEEVGLFNNTLRIDGEVYFYNPFEYKPAVGDYLLVTATRYSHYIAHFSVVADRAQ